MYGDLKIDHLRRDCRRCEEKRNSLVGLVVCILSKTRRRIHAKRREKISCGLPCSCI